MGAHSVTSVAALVAFCWLVVKTLRIGRRRAGLPPGPPTVPLLGNMHMFPTQFPQLKLAEWAREYGDIYSLTLGPGELIVVSSAAAARELLDRRSASTVDRPPNHFNLMASDGLNFVVSQYSDQWRTLRRAANSVLTPQVAARHVPIQRAESFQLMYDLLHTPEKAWWHFRRTTNSAVMSVLYGKRAPRYDTREIHELFGALYLEVKLYDPGAHPPVDLIPILKYVPERFAPWKRICRQIQEKQRTLQHELLQECEERVARGQDVAEECFMDQIVRRREELGLTRDMAAALGGFLLEAGSDTTSTFLQTFILLLTAHPEVQKKLHEEMDLVVGVQRVPTPDDFEHMPYLQACIREAHRYRPIVPLGLPHAALTDEVYREYLIPKGCGILVNQWAIYHDPEVFESPELFVPERFLKSEFGTRPGVDDTDFRHTMLFGFGRRICPGRHVADHAIMVNTMALAWGFDFKPLLNEVTGTPEVVDTWAYEVGAMSTPKPFEFSIKPRSSAHEQIIRAEFARALPSFAAYEHFLNAEEKEWLAHTRKDEGLCA